MPLRKFFKNRKSNQPSCATTKPLLDETLSLTQISPTADTLYLNDFDSYSILIDYGYKIIKTTQISQGQIIEACSIDDEMQKFVIKKMNKTRSFSQKTANILQEASFLRFCSDNEYICKYIDFFHDEKYYYLVMEHGGDITLKTWVKQAFKNIKNGKLNVKRYRKLIKYILWQISSLIYWLHNDRKICHLGIKMENIMVSNCEFIDGADIKIKISDFSSAKEFNIDNEKTDVWQIGILLYKLTFFEYPSDSGLSAIKYNRLSYHICMKNLSRYTTQSMLTLICGMLMYDETKRFDVLKIIQCKWFNDCVLQI